MPNARVIAFYLPQFHTIPENDEWWGEGFTEWTNVRKAESLFSGHNQPRVPTELGYYNLLDPEIRQAQADLANQHGIEGFCYWHYWFKEGSMLLERPLNEVLESGRPDFPFCLGWANHSWANKGFGAGNRMLVEQTYPGIEDHKAHFDWWLTAFTDHRYITVDGKPLLFVYRPKDIPDIKAVTQAWRTWASKAGLPGLYLVGETLQEHECAQYGFNACSHFRMAQVKTSKWWYKPLRILLNNIGKPMRYSHKHVAKHFLPQGFVESEIPYLVPNWDTTPRYGAYADILYGSTPELFRTQVRSALKLIQHKPDQEKILFLKSWNEWAECNYVEPDETWGRGYLEVLRDEICYDGN